MWSVVRKEVWRCTESIVWRSEVQDKAARYLTISSTLTLYPNNADRFLYNPWRPKVFSL